MKGVFLKIKEKLSRHGDEQVSAREYIRRGVMILSACVFIIGAVWVGRSLIDYYRADKLYGELAEDILAANFGDDIGKSEAMRKNLQKLESAYPDIYGYIHIDGTRISFPIVKGEDNEYYLKRAYNGQYMICGAIFADCASADRLEDNRNTVLYGHNMLDGNMFNNIMFFLEEDVFNSKLIEIYTKDGMYVYEPFAIMKTTRDEPYYGMDFASDEDFIGFCEEMQEKSLYNKGMTFTGADRIITLSTCTPSTDVEYYKVGRYALHAKLVGVEE